MKKRLVLFAFTLCFLVISVDAWSQSTNGSYSLAAQDILLNAVSWKEYSFMCGKGDTLSGEFVLIVDGDLFIGDQTKYDNWLLGGVDFLILDEENYSLWRDGEPFTSLYEKETVVKLKWIVEIPHTGVWYVIYVNDSIYMKRIDSSIEHSGPNDILIPLVGLVGVAVFLLVGAAKWKQNH